MIIAIRISGLVGISKKVNETLSRLRLRRKYTAILLKSTEENKNFLKSLRNFIAYGELSNETLKELIEKRAIPKNRKKIDVEKIIEELETKKSGELSIKPFFRLHPPIGGIDSKLHFPIKRGVLGDNKEKINDLVRRML